MFGAFTGAARSRRQQRGASSSSSSNDVSTSALAPSSAPAPESSAHSTADYNPALPDASSSTSHSQPIEALTPSIYHRETHGSEDMVSLEEILSTDILGFSQASSSSFQSGPFEEQQDSFPDYQHDAGSAQQLAWAPSSSSSSQQLEQQATSFEAASNLSVPQRVPSYAGALSDPQRPASFSLDALGPNDSPGSLSQEDIDFILGSLVHDDSQSLPRPPNFSLPFDGRLFRPDSSSGSQQQTPGAWLQHARSSLRGGMKTASPRRRPLSFAGMPTTEDSFNSHSQQQHPMGSMRSVQSADRQGVHELWSNFRQRSQSSLALSDTSMDFDMERDLDNMPGISSPGALSSEFSYSPARSHQQLGQDPDSSSVQQLYGNHPLSRQQLHNLPEEIVEPPGDQLTDASYSERSDSIRQPSIMLSQLTISQQQQQQQEGWNQPELTRRSSAGSNHSLSPTDGSAGPHRRPMRRALPGGAASSNSLSPRSANFRQSVGPSSTNPLLSAISLARRRSPVPGIAGGAPNANVAVAQGEPISKTNDAFFDRQTGTWYHAMPPPSSVGLTDSWNLNNNQGMSAFNQAMQRGDSNETAVSSSLPSLPNTSALDSSYERGQASATYDSSMFDQSVGMLQRQGSGAVTPLSSPSRSSYEHSVLKDRMPKSAMMDSTSHSMQGEASNRATTWPRARPASMMAMSSMPLIESEASENASQRNSMQLGTNEFGVADTRRSLSALGRHHDIETSSLSRPIAGSSRMSDIGPRPRARAGTVSSSQIRRSDRPSDRYDEVRAALDTLRVYMNQTQNASSRSLRRSEGTSHGSSASPLHSRAGSNNTTSENPGRTLRHPPRGPLPPRGQGFTYTVPPPNKEQAAHEERIRVLQDVSDRISDLKQRSEDYLRHHGSED